MTIIPEGTLAYGLQLPVQSQSTLYAAAWERDSGPDELLAMAKAADEHGYLYVAVCDHITVPKPLDEKMGTIWYDTIATLGFLASATSRVRLMSHVWVAPYRHPLVSAKAFATLDHLSKGRVIIGIGAGHVQGEFETLGVDFHQRGRLLDESIDALDVALRDEYPEFTGAHWSFSDGGARPRPEQSPRPPIWVGGSSPAALKRTALKGDGWLPQGTPRAQMPEQIAEIRRIRETGPLAGQPVELGVVTEMIHVGEPTWDVGSHTISGPAEKIAESLNEFGAMGCSHLQVRFRARSIEEQVDQMAAFGSEVGPLLKGGK